MYIFRSDGHEPSLHKADPKGRISRLKQIKAGYALFQLESSRAICLEKPAYELPQQMFTTLEFQPTRYFPHGAPFLQLRFVLNFGFLFRFGLNRYDKPRRGYAGGAAASKLAGKPARQSGGRSWQATTARPTATCAWHCSAKKLLSKGMGGWWHRCQRHVQCGVQALPGMLPT